MATQNPSAVVWRGSVLPAGAFIVKPVFCQDKGLDGYGRQSNVCGYQLIIGRLFELQYSEDGGLTWRHQWTTTTRPEPLIVGKGTWTFIWNTTTNGTFAKRREFRFVDWTDASPRPGPFPNL